MNTSVLPGSMVARDRLEEHWRLKAQKARDLYHVATERYKKLLEERTSLMAITDRSSLVSARRAQTLALEELKRVLRIFTDLTAAGRIPEEGASENGVRD